MPIFDLDNMVEPLRRRVFTLQDQEWFADCSGDFNPVHLDPVAARRELPGAPVVHGMHLMLWALDAYAYTRAAGDFRIVGLKCSFQNPVYLDIPVEIHMVFTCETGAKLAWVQNGLKTAKCSIELEHCVEVAPSSPPVDVRRWDQLPADEPLSALSGKRGETPLQAGTGDLPAHFGHAAGLLGWAGILDLLAITRVVGMECPGWHSMLSSLELSVRRDVARSSLQYAVEEVDSRIGRVAMAVAGGTLSGNVCSFYRPGQVPQIRVADARRMVHSGEFDGQRALIIGGSRGIGEATAQLIAAGGGEVWLTYHMGEADAQALCRAIADAGGRCRCSGYAVGAAAQGVRLVADGGFVPTHVYYFATQRVPKIRHATFSRSRFDSYVDIHVAGFSELHAACAAQWRQPLRFFYPSSILVLEIDPDLLEYACAKAAGEALCRALAAAYPASRFEVARLPVVATELSRGLIETEAASAADVMLPILRSMQGVTDPVEECRP